MQYEQDLTLIQPENVAGVVDTGSVVTGQKSFFHTGRTKDIGYRSETLRALKSGIRRYEDDIFDALYADLGKSSREAFVTEVGLVLKEITLHERKVRRWSRPRRVPGSLLSFPSRSRIHQEPFGVALIIAPWNYPFQLLFSPLVGALSAGNCVVLKPSEHALHTAAVAEQIVTDVFDPGHVTVVQGGADASSALLQERFDYIFYTGGEHVGRIVHKAAAEHLTPVTLELGGKSPCIVDADADIDVAAKRIVWGKFINAGQSCIAPDYILVDHTVQLPLLESMTRWIREFWGDDPSGSAEYGRIINQRHFDRLTGMLSSGDIVCGGTIDRDTLYIAPTILTNVLPDDPVMQEEIFGPILPVIEYGEIGEAISFVNARPKPLALYSFGKRNRADILGSTSAGGCCVNDTVMQFADMNLPFGGVGNSGMGAYHGKYSFDMFSHAKPVTTTTTLFDLPVRYPGFRNAMRVFRMLMR